MAADRIDHHAEAERFLALAEQRFSSLDAGLDPWAHLAVAAVHGILSLEQRGEAIGHVSGYIEKQLGHLREEALQERDK